MDWDFEPRTGSRGAASGLGLIAGGFNTERREFTDEEKVEDELGRPSGEDAGGNLPMPILRRMGGIPDSLPPPSTSWVLYHSCIAADNLKMLRERDAVFAFGGCGDIF